MGFDQVVPGETAAAKEYRRWNTPKSQGGMKPDGFEPFPAMLFKARRPPNGGPYIVINPLDEQWSQQNYMTVQSEREQDRCISEGWRRTPEEAIAHANALETAISDAAAARQNTDRRLSEKAQAEARLVDESTAEHVPEITPALVRKARGRPRKA